MVLRRQTEPRARDRPCSPMGIQSALESVDWDFASARPATGPHNIHPYPAKFIPEIPRHLISLVHPGDDSGLLDPFCGSGTALLEGIDSGLSVWGIDLNPLACLIARVKTTPLPQPIGPIARQLASAARTRIAHEHVPAPAIPRLDHWFKPVVQQPLAALVESIRCIQNTAVREALQVALSSIIVQVSNQESDTRYAAIEKGMTSEDVFTRFEKSAASVDHSLSLLSDNLFRKLGRSTIINRDILDVVAIDKSEDISLVVTSPPYPNAYEYWLYHKYRMYWLDMDPIEVRRREIGARPHYFKKNHQDETDFERQMSAVFRLLSKVMRADGIACFLVGRSVIHGRVINNADLLERAARPHGFLLRGKIQRSIAKSRKTFNLAHANIHHEHLLVFVREVR